MMTEDARCDKQSWNRPLHDTQGTIIFSQTFGIHWKEEMLARRLLRLYTGKGKSACVAAYADGVFEEVRW